ASGFGVGIEASRAATFTSYTLFDETTGAIPTLKDAVGKTLSNFAAINSARDIRNQKPGTAQQSDISGKIKLTGSYSFPFAANNLSLASAKLPFNYAIAVQPQLEAKVSGAIEVTGDYIVRCYRKNERELELGVYKKRGTELSASFTAAAGLGASGDGTDLISEFFGAVAPGINPKAAGLSDQDAKAIQKTLNDCLDRSLSISLNLSCSAAFRHESAVVYRVDLAGNQSETDAAIDAALSGDWTPISKLSNATQLRNVVTDSREQKHSITVNLLGIYNYESVADFVQACTVVHSPEDGSITVCDKETASRISVASTPYVADANRLRAAISEATLATMTYAAMNGTGKLGATIKVTQSFLLYKSKLDAKSLHKDLLVGIALRVISPEEWQKLIATNAAPRHVRIAAQAIFEADAAQRLFFSDVAARSPRKLEELKQVGRNTLSSLLDRTDPADDRRWRILNDPNAWAQMDKQQFPHDSPASYSDWYDVTFWAEAVSKVAPLLKDALQAVDQTTAADPTTDSNFMKKRAALASALAAVTRNSHAAFEVGWPISVMCALSGFSEKLTFQAAWDGKTYLDKTNPQALSHAQG
ncbi:MAG: hypothetical protein JOZ48_13785, partial [Acidobacteriaceae bacterium]|nr:hypothetical protein [Acidobacteriaceae bacterium]